MNKNILIVGASGLVGSQIFKNLKKDDNCLVLLGRKRLSSENNTEQIISDFQNEKLNIQIKDYYFSNAIARSSKTMIECNNSKLNIKSTGTEG